MMNDPFIARSLPCSWLIFQVLKISDLKVYQVTDPLYKSILIKLFQKSTFLQIQN